MPIDYFLARSAASASFRDAVKEFRRSGRPNPAVAFELRCPPVKVERTLTKILEAYANLPIERVAIEAVSGCELFRGTARIEAGDRTVEVDFEWNCKWKAQQLGWVDWFGLPDQARAAHEHGYDCFRAWDEQGLADAAAA